MSRSLAICALGFALAWSGLAGAADLDQTIAEHPDVTYFDLMKLVIADLAKGEGDNA